MYVSNVSINRQLKRRKQAAIRQVRAGKTCRSVARSVGVSKSTISRWSRAAAGHGHAGHAKSSLDVKRAGRPRKLNETQIERLKKELLKGACHHGYDSDHWTLKRITGLIAKRFGVNYEASAVWHVMKRIGWSSQKPQLRAVQRDEAQIAHWQRYVFPQLKKRTATGSQDDLLG